jgi:hypothetical protein
MAHSHLGSNSLALLALFYPPPSFYDSHERLEGWASRVLQLPVQFLDALV